VTSPLKSWAARRAKCCMARPTKAERRAAAAVLVAHNLWRRGDETLEMTCPRLLGLALEVAIAALHGSMRKA